MQFTTLLPLSALFSNVALAVPSNAIRSSLTPGAVVVSEVPKYITEGAAAYAAKLNATSSLAKRADVGVYLCVDKDFSGYCVHIVQPANVCIELADDLNDKVTAVGPDTSAGDCRFFLDFRCDNDQNHFDAQSPGIPNLANTFPGANDAISSYICFG